MWDVLGAAANDDVLSWLKSIDQVFFSNSMNFGPIEEHVTW